MPARTLIIGLDAADPGLLARWSAEGSLPAIHALSSTGVSGRLSTPAGLGDDAVWPSFYTGRPVGHHGRYFWTQLAPGAGALVPSCDRFPERPALWSALCDAGLRVAVIDVPKGPLARMPNGIQLCDWLVHGRDYQSPKSVPEDLALRIRAEFGDAPPSLCAEFMAPLTDRMIQEVRENLCRSADMKRRCATQLLGTSAWDLFIVAFKEAHCGSHAFWHLVDPSHPDHVPGQDARHGEPLKAVYRQLDCAVQALIAQAGPDSSVLLFTTLSMAANHTGNHLMAGLVSRINSRFGGPVETMLHAWRAGRHALCRALPHNEASGAIRINVAGRDPGGSVQPGAAYDALCARLIDELSQLADPVTGRRLVSEIIKTRETFPGPAAHHFPDLFIVWDRSAPIGAAVRSPRLGMIAGVPPSHRRTGNHSPGGCYIVSGPAARAWPAEQDIDISDLLGKFLKAANLDLSGGVGAC